jgi:hypothetical protein
MDEGSDIPPNSGLNGGDKTLSALRKEVKIDSNFLDALPLEIHWQILKYHTPPELFFARGVCRCVYQLVLTFIESKFLRNSSVIRKDVDSGRDHEFRLYEMFGDEGSWYVFWRKEGPVPDNIPIFSFSLVIREIQSHRVGGVSGNNEREMIWGRTWFNRHWLDPYLCVHTERDGELVDSYWRDRKDQNAWIMVSPLRSLICYLLREGEKINN